MTEATLIAEKKTSMPKTKKNVKKVWKRFNPLFWITVLIPTFCSIFYFTFWASDVYISESSFVVRSSRNQASLSGVGALLQSIGFARSQDDTYTVQEFMRSRNVLEQLETILPMRKYYEDNGDFFSRFNALGLNGEKEAFYHYFQKQEVINLDSVSGIATLNIRAFNPEDAQKINIELLRLGETLINRLNERARKDTIIFAEQAVKDAEVRVTDSATALSEYRVKYGIFDLQAQSDVQLTLISKLQSELINIRTQLDQVRAISPQNPQVKTLQAREKSIRAEIQQQIQTIFGGNDSIANQTAEYQRLVLDNTLAQQQLTTAITSLQNAKGEADRQQLYLEVINQPSKPDLALEPFRIYNIFATFIIGLILYGILSLLLASVREHKN
ncbi:capsular polysaccharide transport system permease protein [Pasteurella testudinis DSM 23072]|uniref:Capsular polysaccharide transport system permease protein n=1 Tax=Pasteurella testudinis DSM 23072 TaxID=1122938 RepID=A0A1W1V8T4_9PAST|nr:capsular polysaccharide transport system permease protein [Pasteurella testudinis DSM 23072]SUB52102.1 protein HexC [Pasteurella testudinis]